MLKCYSDLNFIDQQIGFDVYIVGIQSKDCVPSNVEKRRLRF